jgi:hypothetical protein
MTRLKSFAALACAALVASCGDAARQTITEPVTGPQLKFFNFGVNAPGINFFANDVKVTAISSTTCTPAPATPNPACTSTGAETTTGSTYGVAANGGLYSMVPAGSVAIAGKIATVTDNGVAVNTTTSNLENGKYYSFYTSGIYDAAAKKNDGFLVEDPLPATIDFTSTAYVRFVNASSNASALTLFAKNTSTNVETPVGAAAAYKAAGAFTAVPVGIYDVSVRSGASGTNLATLAAVGFSGGRVYTIALRGDMTVTSTTAANRPILQSNLNR